MRSSKKRYAIGTRINSHECVNLKRFITLHGAALYY